MFRNDPADVAQVFGDLLLEAGEYRDRFRTVVFAVLDRADDNRIIGPFREIFDVGGS